MSLTLPHLPSLRELRVVGGIHTFLTVASPTLRKLDCTAGGKDLRLHLECPLLEDVVPRLRVRRLTCSGRALCPSAVSSHAHFRTNAAAARSYAAPPATQAVKSVLHGSTIHVASSAAAAAAPTSSESCKGLYSTETRFIADVPGPTTSGPASLWRIPDGVRVTYCDRA